MANSITFGRMDSAGPGNGGTIEILHNGNRVGFIEKDEMDANHGGALRQRRYVVEGYQITFYDIQGSDRCFRLAEGGDPRSLLKEVKAFARSVLSK